jgi:hypothetical protein
MFIAARDQLQSIAHRRQIGGDVERVGENEDDDKRHDERTGTISSRLAAIPLPVTRPMRALTSWIAIMNGMREPHRPQQRVAELRTALRVWSRSRTDHRRRRR